MVQFRFQHLERAWMAALMMLLLSPVLRETEAQTVSFSIPAIRSADTIRVGKGHPPTVVAVFATWCRSCKDEVATFNALSRELASSGIRFVALSADEVSNDRLIGWLDRYKVGYTVMRDTSGAALRALEVVGVPEVHLLDSTGRVVWRHRGPVEGKLAKLKDQLHRMCTGEPRC